MIQLKNLREVTELVNLKNDLTGNEENHIRSYVTADSSPANYYLRDIMKYPRGVKTHALAIQRGIKKFKTTEPVETHRGFLLRPEEFNNLMKTIGEQTKKSFRLKGFHSTSKSKYVAETYAKAAKPYNGRGVMFHIHIPVGVHAFDVNKHLGNEHELAAEKELILPHGARFQLHPEGSDDRNLPMYYEDEKSPNQWYKPIFHIHMKYLGL